jgi:hypothetical protein
MADLALPSPPNGESDASGTAESSGAADASRDAADRNQGSRAKQQVLSEEECLAALTQLPKLLLMGLVSTGQASVIRATVNAILQHHAKRSTAGGAGLSGNDPQLIAALRANPALANFLAPFLSAEDIDAILRQVKEDTDNGSH